MKQDIKILKNTILEFVRASGTEFFGWICRLSADFLDKEEVDNDAIELAGKVVLDLWREGFIIVGTIRKNSSNLAHIDEWEEVILLKRLDEVCQKIKTGHSEAQFDIWLEAKK